ITACGPNDGCCPPGCGLGQDPNCTTPICGNGVVETPERCDTQIAAGQPGACPRGPADCNDGNLCTVDSVAGPACDARCVHTPLTTCSLVPDGCCPSSGAGPLCNANNDIDCSPVCGNGVLEPGELCDPPSTCPTAASCNDGISCTSDTLNGSATTCNARCSHSAVTTCSLGTSDNCCPYPCSSANDLNCFGTWTTQTLGTGLSVSCLNPTGDPFPRNCPCTPFSVALTAGHSYLATTCTPTGPALPGNGDTTLEVLVPGGAQIAVN